MRDHLAWWVARMLPRRVIFFATVRLAVQVVVKPPWRRPLTITEALTLWSQQK